MTTAPLPILPASQSGLPPEIPPAMTGTAADTAVDAYAALFQMLLLGQPVLPAASLSETVAQEEGVASAFFASAQALCPPTTLMPSLCSPPDSSTGASVPLTPSDVGGSIFQASSVPLPEMAVLLAAPPAAPSVSEAPSVEEAVPVAVAADAVQPDVLAALASPVAARVGPVITPTGEADTSQPIGGDAAESAAMPAPPATTTCAGSDSSIICLASDPMTAGMRSTAAGNEGRDSSAQQGIATGGGESFSAQAPSEGIRGDLVGTQNAGDQLRQVLGRTDAVPVDVQVNPGADAQSGQSVHADGIESTVLSRTETTARAAGPSRSQPTTTAPDVPSDDTRSMPAPRTMPAVTLATTGAEVSVDNGAAGRQHANDRDQAVRMNDLSGQERGSVCRAAQLADPPQNTDYTSARGAGNAGQSTTPASPTTKTTESVGTTPKPDPVSVARSSDVVSGAPAMAKPVDVTPDTQQSAPATRFIIETPVSRSVPGHIVVRLEPPELGRIRIDLSAGPVGVVGRLRLTSEVTRATVERDIGQLRQSLADAGVRVERLEIATVSRPVETALVNADGAVPRQGPDRMALGRSLDQQNPGENPWRQERQEHERRQRGTPFEGDSPWARWAPRLAAAGINVVA